MPKSDPLFSVITITWNNINGLKATKKSLISQKSNDYEWLVIDGKSNDGTQDFLGMSDFSALKWISEPDDGLYDAMNKGIDRAKGKYLIFMNAGDVFADENVLDKTANSINASEIKADIYYGDSFEEENGKLLLKNAFPHERIWYSMFTHHQAMFYKREAIGELRYELSLTIAADWALTASIYKNGGKFEKLNFPICIFERGGLSQSGRSDVVKKMHQERLWVYRNIFKMPAWRAYIILAVKQGVEKVRYKFPRVYDAVRFK